MADTKISDLAAVTDVLTTDEYVLARAGASKKITAADLSAGMGGSGGLFSGYALLRDQKTANTSGGTATTGSFQTHALQTEVYDGDGIVTLSSNEFTLGAGSYLIQAWAAHYQTGRFKLKIRNVTDSTDVDHGASSFSTSGGGNDAMVATVKCVTTIAGTKAFSLMYRADSTASTRDLGVEANHGVVEVYAEVEIWRLT